MPYKTWVAGEEVLASDFNAFVQEQVVATFSTSAARTAAIPSPKEGMVTWLADVDRLETWTGTAWRAQPRVYNNVDGSIVAAPRIRAGMILTSSDGLGNFILNLNPPLGTMVSVNVGPGSHDVTVIISPYIAQFTPGATAVTFYVQTLSGVTYTGPLRMSYVIIDY